MVGLAVVAVVACAAGLTARSGSGTTLLDFPMNSGIVYPMNADAIGISGLTTAKAIARLDVGTITHRGLISLRLRLKRRFSTQSFATGRPQDFVAGTRVPRSGLPRVFVRALACISMQMLGGRCSCTRSVRSTQPAAAQHSPRVRQHNDVSHPGIDGSRPACSGQA